MLACTGCKGYNIGMETKTLIDPLIKPDSNVLEAALGKNYKLHEEFIAKIKEKNLVPEWHYYNDGKSWLCKILNKKKNLCWLSVWNTGFKLTFYFTEKTIGGALNLDIDNKIKENVAGIKPAGKLIPILILISSKKALAGGMKLLEYKMSLK